MSQATAATFRAAAGWRAAAIALALLAIATLALYADTAADAVRLWNRSSTHAFSYLILPISAYFVWLRRPLLARLAPRPMPWAVVLALPAALAWLVGDLTQTAVLAQFAVVVLLQVAVLALLGWAIFRALLFPVLLLWLLVPFGEALLPALVELTTALTVAGLGLLGMRVSTDGNILITEIGRFGVVESCSALDFLIGNTVISLVYANLMFRGWAKRTLYVLAGLPVAILANGIRTTTVIWLTYISDQKIDLLADHETYGWLLFCAAVATQMAIGWRFRDPPGEPDMPAVGSAPARRLLPVAAALALVLAAAPALARLALDRPAATMKVALCPPAALGPASALDEWQPRYGGAAAELAARYRVDGRGVDLYVAYYPALQRDREMVNRRNRPFDGKVWKRLDRQTATVRIDGQAVDLPELRLRGPKRARRLVWQVYWIDGRLVTADWAAKLWRLADDLGAGGGAAAVLISADAKHDPAQARADMQALLDRAPFPAPMLQAARSGAGC